MGIEKGSYEMIVSSPGIERKLKTNRHFELALGELVKIKLFEPIEDEYVLEGYLDYIEDKRTSYEYIGLDRNLIDEFKLQKEKRAKSLSLN